MQILEVIDQILKIIQSIVITCGVIVGFFTWRSHLLKEKKFDAAKNLFQSIISIKTQINYFRSPFVSSGEQLSALENQNIDPPKDFTARSNKASAAVFRERWQKVYEAYNKYELIKIEAKAILDLDIDKVAKQFESLIRKIWSTTTLFITHYERLSEGMPGILTNLNVIEMSKIIYSGFHLEGEVDVFENDLTESINEIKNGLNKYLSLK